MFILVWKAAFGQSDSSMEEYQEQVLQWKSQKDSIQKGNSKKKQNFDEAKLLFETGKDLDKKGDLINAINAYEKSVFIYPMTRPLIHLAKAYQKNGQDAKALLNYEKVLDLPKVKEKDIMSVLSGMTNVRLSFKDYNAALKKIEPYFLQFPSNDQPYYLKGKILKESGKELESIVFFKKAIELDSKNKQAAYELANSLNKNEDYTAANECIISHMSDVKEDSFLQSALWFELAESYRGLADKTRAIEYYQKASAHKKWKEFSEYWIQQLTP